MYSEYWREELENSEDVQSYINLNLAIILQACIDGDKEWFKSTQFNATILSIPDKAIQKELGVGLIEMSPKQIGKLLIKKIEQGIFRGRKAVC